MSARNTGLFLLGTVSPSVVAEALSAWPEYAPEHFAGAEGPRVGHATWHGQPVTHVALRVFEVMGFRLLNEESIPDPDDLEMVLGRELSRSHPVIFASYDDELMAGGAARFESGALRYRDCVEGQAAIPTRRTLHGAHPIEDLDPSLWIWPHASAALSGAFAPELSPAPKDDDDIEQLVLQAKAQPIPLHSRPPPSPAPTPRTRKRDRVRRALRGWWQS